MEIMILPYTHSSGRRRLQKGFTLAETLVAMAVTVISLLGFYAAASQAMRIVRTGKEIAAGSQMVQQRIENFRYTPPWTNVTTVAGISSIESAATVIAANFSSATETVTVEPYPTTGSKLVVTRSPSGAISSSGLDMSSQTRVKFTVAVSWTGTGNIPRSRQLSTILTKGGI